MYVHIKDVNCELIAVLLQAALHTSVTSTLLPAARWPASTWTSRAARTTAPSAAGCTSSANREEEYSPDCTVSPSSPCSTKRTKMIAKHILESHSMFCILRFLSTQIRSGRTILDDKSEQTIIFSVSMELS